MSAAQMPDRSAGIEVDARVVLKVDEPPMQLRAGDVGTVESVDRSDTLFPSAVVRMDVRGQRVDVDLDCLELEEN